MKDLRRRFERFCLKNRGKGIPNLMLVIAIGNLVVYVLSRVDPSNIVNSRQTCPRRLAERLKQR